MILDKDRLINIAADIRVSLGWSECPKRLDLKQIPGAAWEKVHSSSSIYIYIALELSTALQYHLKGLVSSHSLCNLTPFLSDVPYVLTVILCTSCQQVMKQLSIF